MNEDLKQSADLFFGNMETVGKAFPFENAHMNILCALAYSAKGMDADTDRMKEAEEFLRKNTGIFSDFKGNAKLMLMVQMAQAEDIEAYFGRVQSVYSILEKGKLLSSSYDVIAAMVIAQNGSADSMTDEEYVEKTNSIYARMKENHPWLTNEEDLGFAAMLATTGLNEDAIIAEMEECYQLLKEKKIASDDGIQSLSHVLSLEVGNAEVKSDKVASVYAALKERGRKYGTSFEISTLGGFAFTDADSEALADEIAEMDDYLKGNKNIGLFGAGLSAEERLMYAAILVLQQYCPETAGVHTAAMIGEVSMIIVEQVLMMAIVANCLIMAVNASH